MQLPNTQSAPLPDSPAVLRVGHVVCEIAQEASGPSYTVPALARSQGVAGHHVSVHSLGTPVAPPAGPWHDYRYPKDLAATPVVAKLGLSRALRDGLISAECDLLHAHGLWQMPGVYAARAGKPLVVAPRGMLAPAALHYSRGRKRAFALAVQSRALGRAAMFHATAPSEYEDIRAYGLRQPVAVVPNGVDVPEAPDRSRVTPVRRVVSLGRIHPKKGLDLLIRAWANIEAVHPYWRLDIVGPDEAGHLAQLQALVEQLGVRNVSLSGPLYGAAKWRAYSEADLFVLPTRSENFAVTVAEALASGVPVISSKGAPWSGLQPMGCGWWIDHGVADISGALDHAMRLDDDTRVAMGARGRAWMIRDFSWDTIARDMVAAYGWLLNGGPLPSHVRVE